MPLAFLAPLFLAGLGLVAVPWILHRIRRPEHDPVRFSSLMFIPRITKEVIERRRLQHLILMLLRMAAFIFLALAFARPIWRARPGAQPAGAGVRRMILLDRSMSMGARDADGTAFERAKARVLEIVKKGGGAEDEIGVITFAASPEMMKPLSAPKDTPPKPATAAATETALPLEERIAALAVGEEGTRYQPALELAQSQLLVGESGEDAPTRRLELYLVTDFQRGGLATAGGGQFRLSPRITLFNVDVGRDIDNNIAITGAGARASQNGRVRVQAKLRNGSATDEKTAEARLVLGAEARDSRKVTLKPGSASLVSFEVERKPGESLQGRIELAEEDALAADNRRYFTFSDPPRRGVLMVGAAKSNERYPQESLVSAAIGIDAAGPWRLESAEQSAVAEKLTGALQPEVLILCDPGPLEAPAAKAVSEWLAKGGHVFLLLGPRTPPDDINAALLTPLGLRASGPRFVEDHPSRFILLSSIDFTHPVFAPFAGPRFNDFSQLRFYNYDLLTGPPEKMKVLARFEADDKGTEWPAVAEIAAGEGRLMIWTFGADLAWSSAAKNVKFSPMIQETLRSLTATRAQRQEWTVGDPYEGRPSEPASAPRWTFELPGGATQLLDPASAQPWAAPRLAHAGLLNWRAEGASATASVEAVNIDPAESDLRRIDPGEFALKIGAQVEGASPSAQVAAAGPGGDWIVLRNYWRPLLLLMAAALMLECWYAARVMR